jgi:hypothetical protein
LVMTTGALALILPMRLDADEHFASRQARAAGSFRNCRTPPIGERQCGSVACAVAQKSFDPFIGRSSARPVRLGAFFRSLPSLSKRLVLFGLYTLHVRLCLVCRVFIRAHDLTFRFALRPLSQWTNLASVPWDGGWIDGPERKAIGLRPTEFVLALGHT